MIWFPNTSLLKQPLEHIKFQNRDSTYLLKLNIYTPSDPARGVHAYKSAYEVRSQPHCSWQPRLGAAAPPLSTGHVNCGLFRPGKTAQQWEQMSTTSNSTDESHARKLATVIPTRIHTVQFLSHRVCIEGLPLWGENSLWCQAGVIALGKETQDETRKAQGSFWDSAALLPLAPCTYPTGVCNGEHSLCWMLESCTLFCNYMLIKRILKVDALIFICIL